VANSLRILDAVRRGCSRRSVRLLLFVCAAAALLVGRSPVRPFVLAQANPVVGENSQTGNFSNEWDVAGSGDPSIQGFATDISVNKGDPVYFKIKTDSSNYRIDIYRLGYYGGAGARLVAANLAPSAALPQTQPSCLIDPDTGLADCGQWSVSASWSTAGATSGIYIAKLKRLDVGGASHIVFVVRDDARQADIVVQTSDTTWQAYNQYGGGSLYCGGPQSNAGTVYSCTGRATKVSYNRPFDTRAHDATSFVFNAEYPMVRWLEANGYDVKYISGVDTERHAADLAGTKKPKVFLSVGHDEYWSAGQRASVEAARNAGVHLAFFSGNEMYWKTRWEPSVDGSATPYRTLVGYKDTLGGVKLDPMPKVTTGTWRDMRFAAPVADGGKPENGLIGQIWTVNSGTSAITVPASMAGLRFWRNTSIAGMTSGLATLGADTLGYEWDEDLDNGSRPAGLIHLSATTVSGVEKILDFGETVGIGTATHNLTLYRHDNGAMVFGAGTVQWSWGLDSNHDRGNAPASPAMQQATMNLLADMGAQPGTVQPGLIASSASVDSARPSSAITTPAAGSSVGSGDRVTITGTAADSGGVVAGVEVSVDGGTTWRAATGTSSWSYEWTPGAPGQATIRTRAIDDSGNLELAGGGVTVIIDGANCPCPSLWSTGAVPAVADVDDPSPVELGVKFRSDISGFVKGVRFYKSTSNTGTHIGNLWSATGTLLATAEFSGETPSGWQEVVFSAPVSISANTLYVVSYHTNVGHYSASPTYFATLGVDRAPLHAPATASAGGNGVFGYGASQFPTGTFNGTNYWVDVVFDSTPDTAPPAIGDVSATPVDGSTALVRWTTDEAATSSVDYSTDATFFAPATQTVSDAAYVTSHSMRLTSLRPNTAYFFRVRSVDRAGNVAAKPPMGPTPPPAPGQTPPPVQGFTMPSPTLHDTTSADFNGGLSSGTYTAETEDGELTLAPARGSEFSGSTMPGGWATRIWSDGGTAVVAGGRLTVDGARVATCVDVGGVCQEQYHLAPGMALEFTATFTGDPYQHSGLGQTLESSFEPMALFSTSWTDANGGFQSGSNLGVRTYDGSSGNGETRTTLGTTLLNAPHRYRIEWLPAEIVYSVDGAEVARHAVSITAPMRPVAASDFNAFSGRVVVDWVRHTPYVSAGSFISRVFDGTTGINWENISWVADTPAGTSVVISIRTGETATPDETWTPFAAVTPGPVARQSRYIQYRAELATSDLNLTPSLADIRISGAAPPAPVPVITPVVAWPAPAPISYGVALSALQLRATTNPAIEGTFTYDPPAGSVLPAGDRPLSVTFTPTDTAHYTSAQGSVMLHVNKASPVITWPAPAAITYGAALGAAQLNASANVAGSFVYTPAAGTVLGGGSQTLTTTFTPTDTSNYDVASASVGLTVQKANPSITWATPGPITYGTPLGAAQLNATANVPGSFAYTPAAGTVLAAGNAQVLSAAFTPANTANYNNASATVTINVVKPTGTVTVTSSNSPSLFGVPVTLTATIVPTTATGSVTFKDGTTTLGSAAVNAGLATINTATLSVGTHSITAVYSGDSAVMGATSAAFSQVISPSAKIAVSFAVQALQDDTKKPKVATIPVPNAQVKVFSTANACVGNFFKSISPKKWGQIFDGADGAGTGVGCPAISVGSYQAVGTTNAAGAATIIVPPLDFTLNLTSQYVVIAKATNFDYVKTASTPDPLYSAYPILMVAANTTREAPLAALATFNGKIVPGKQAEFFGSYLNIIQPEYMDWTEDVEQYPFVMVAQGGWNLTTSVTPPEGFIPDEPAMTAAVADTTTALQFTMTDVGSDWTETTVNHSIVHNGATITSSSSIPMVDKKATTARNDARKVMHDSSATMLDVMVNDKVNHLRKPLHITGITPALNGAVVVTDDGLNVSYKPTPGYSGVDSFTYTITDAIGGSSTGTVTVTVLATPELSVRNATAPEGNSGASAVTFNVVLSNQSLDTVTVNYQTVDGTAAAGADYEAASGTVVFAPLVTSMPITVQVLGDIKAESNEKFSVKLSSPTNATIAAAPGGDVTITDDDPPEASIAATASIVEGNINGTNNVAVNVTLSQSHAESVWVNYATSDGTAVAGSDYVKTTGTLQFYPGTVTKTIYVPVYGDTVGEKTETFYVDISAPLNATLTSTRATVSIVNDDTANQVFTSAADFGAGTVGAGAYVSDTTGGEIMLAPAQGDEFSGALSPSWTIEPLAAGGGTATAGGKLAVDGAAVLGTVTGSGKTLEFSAVFTGRPDQAIGFSASSTPASPMAMFVIGADRQLYARTIYGTKWFEQPMAGVDWLNKSIRYQITWNAGNAQYYINGTLMITHSNMAWGTVMMRPAVVDTAAGDGGLSIDWMRMTPYAASGTYTSAVFDAGDSGTTWVKLTTTSTVPTGTTSTITYRTGSTPVPDETWTAFTALGTGGVMTGTSRYVQYSIQMSSTAVTKTPLVQDVTIQFK